MSLDVAGYTRDLYGPGGAKFDPAFLEPEDGQEEGDDAAGEEGDASEDS